MGSTAWKSPHYLGPVSGKRARQLRQFAVKDFYVPPAELTSEQSSLLPGHFLNGRADFFARRFPGSPQLVAVDQFSSQGVNCLAALMLMDRSGSSETAPVPAAGTNSANTQSVRYPSCLRNTGLKGNKS